MRPPSTGEEPPKRPDRTTLDVRFREVDAYGVVWHGHYVDWMEAARNRYAEAFGFRLVDELAQGYVAPVLELAVDYRKSARLGDRVAIDVRLAEDARRVVAFRYRVSRLPDGELLATGRTVQALVGPRGLLLGWPTRVHELLAAIRAYEETLPPW